MAKQAGEQLEWHDIKVQLAGGSRLLAVSKILGPEWEYARMVVVEKTATKVTITLERMGLDLVSD